MLLRLLPACIPLTPSGGPLDTATVSTCASDWDGDTISYAEGDCRPEVAYRVESCNGVDDDCDGKADEGASECYLPSTGGVGGLGYGHVWWKMGVTACDSEFGGAWLSWGFDAATGGTGCTIFAEMKRYGDKPEKACPDCLWAFSMYPDKVTITGELCDANSLDRTVLDSIYAKWGFTGDAMLAYYDGVWFEFARRDTPDAHVVGDENYAYVEIRGDDTYFRYDNF